MTDRQDAEQLELGLDLREPVPAPWWVELIEHETEGVRTRCGGERERGGAQWRVAPSGRTRTPPGPR